MTVDRKKELDKLYWFLDLPPNRAEVKIKIFGIDKLINGIVAVKKMEDTRVTFKIDSKEPNFSGAGIEYILWNGRKWRTGKADISKQAGFKKL